jgi:hypothetical protein
VAPVRDRLVRSRDHACFDSTSGRLLHREIRSRYACARVTPAAGVRLTSTTVNDACTDSGGSVGGVAPVRDDWYCVRAPACFDQHVGADSARGGYGLATPACAPDGPQHVSTSTTVNDAAGQRWLYAVAPVGGGLAPRQRLPRQQCRGRLLHREIRSRYDCSGRNDLQPQCSTSTTVNDPHGQRWLVGGGACARRLDCVRQRSLRPANGAGLRTGRIRSRSTSPVPPGGSGHGASLLHDVNDGCTDSRLTGGGACARRLDCVRQRPPPAAAGAHPTGEDTVSLRACAAGRSAATVRLDLHDVNDACTDSGGSRWWRLCATTGTASGIALRPARRD